MNYNNLKFFLVRLIVTFKIRLTSWTRDPTKEQDPPLPFFKPAIKKKRILDNTYTVTTNSVRG